MGFPGAAGWFLEEGRRRSRRPRQVRKPATFTGGDRGNGSGSIRLVWGKLLEETGARRAGQWTSGARGAGRDHGQRGGAAERSRAVRARGGRRQVEGRSLTSGPGRSGGRGARDAGRALASGLGRKGRAGWAAAGPEWRAGWAAREGRGGRGSGPAEFARLGLRVWVFLSNFYFFSKSNSNKI